MKVPLLILLFLISNFSFSQKNIDSLYTLLNKNINDSTKIEVLIDISYAIENSKTDSAIFYYKKALQLADKNKNIIKKGNIYRYIGWCYLLKSEFDKTLQYMNEALKIAEIELEKNNQNYDALNLKSKALGGIGNFYFNQSNYSNALEYFIKALKINEKLNNKNGISTNYTNIGLVYVDMDQPQKALDYYFKALEIEEGLLKKAQTDLDISTTEMLKDGIATILGNIGAVYRRLNENKKALDFYFNALKINEEINNERGLAINLGNIAIVYDIEGNYDKALEFYNMAIIINSKVNNKMSLINNYNNLAMLFIDNEKYTNAEKLLFKALDLCNQTGDLYYKESTYEYLSELFSITNRHKDALAMYKQYIEIRDSLNNEENQKQFLQKELQYEFDKKEAAIKLEQEKRDAISKAEKERQRLFLFLISFIAIAIAIVALVVFRSLKLAKQQKGIIEEQKLIVEEKQKEIIDSINYAKRIQEALLTSEVYIERNIKRLNQ